MFQSERNFVNFVKTLERIKIPSNQNFFKVFSFIQIQNIHLDAGKEKNRRFVFPGFNLIGGKFEFRNEQKLLAELFREVHVSVKIPFDGFSIFWLPWLGETNPSLLDFGIR